MARFGALLMGSAALALVTVSPVNAQGVGKVLEGGLEAVQDAVSSITGTPDDGLPVVLPLEDVITDGLPTVGEFAGAEGVLRFVSAIPLACSVVFGETTAYGSLTLDQDMNGGAHSDHHPVLSGLKPDTEYHFRVQGTAEDGRIFASRNMTFRTPPAEAATEVNLLAPDMGAQVVNVSSNFGGGDNAAAWGANSALDGQRSTAWSSNGDGDEAFLEVALPSPSHLHAVEVWTRSMSDGSAQVSTFKIMTDTGEEFGPFTLANADQAHRFEIDAQAANLRLEVISSTGGNTGLVEFAAFGTPLSDMPMTDTMSDTMTDTMDTMSDTMDAASDAMPSN